MSHPNNKLLLKCILFFVSLCLLSLSMVGCNERYCRDDSICDGYRCGRNHLCIISCESFGDEACQDKQGFKCLLDTCLDDKGKEKEGCQKVKKCLCDPKDKTLPCHYHCYKAEDCDNIPSLKALMAKRFPNLKESERAPSKKGYVCHDPKTKQEPENGVGQCFCGDDGECMGCKKGKEKGKEHNDCNDLRKLNIKAKEKMPDVDPKTKKKIEEKDKNAVAYGYICKDDGSGTEKCVCNDDPDKKALCQKDQEGGGDPGGEFP